MSRLKKVAIDNDAFTKALKDYMDTTGAYEYTIGDVVETTVTFSVTEKGPDGSPDTYNLTVVEQNGKYVVKNDNGDILPIP